MLRRVKGQKRQRKQYVKAVRHNVPSLASVLYKGDYEDTRKKSTSMYRRQYQLGALICGICEKEIEYRSEITTDHIIPKSRGGSNRKDNLQPAHKSCNGRKGNLLPEEYKRETRHF